MKHLTIEGLVFTGWALWFTDVPFICMAAVILGIEAHRHYTAWTLRTA